MVNNYDFVITSGGIGPTHDGTFTKLAGLYHPPLTHDYAVPYISDITYASLAKAFNQPLAHHQETLRRMAEMSRNRPSVAQQDEEQKTARERMALFPAEAEVLYIESEIWVVCGAFCQLFFPSKLDLYFDISSQWYDWEANFASFRVYQGCSSEC